MVNVSFLTSSFAFLGSSGVTTPNQGRSHALYSHPSLSSQSTPTATVERANQNPCLRELCELLNVTPVDLLRLEDDDDGTRGIYLDRPVERGDVIVQIPLSSCLVDTQPPNWWSQANEPDLPTDGYHTPSDWVPRLAASLLDLRLFKKYRTSKSAIDQGKHLYLSFMPHPDRLRASLPVHWSEETLQSAKCLALELAVDTAYFARAEAVADLVLALPQNNPVVHYDQERLCHWALDIVQTRSCRVDDSLGRSRTMRVLAPVFDLINHGASGTANARFEMTTTTMVQEDRCLAVRATRDIAANEQVLLDYGTSAQPAWKCLLSYGFVPNYTTTAAEEDNDSDVEGENGTSQGHVAELFLDGHRYEVGPSSIPLHLVAAVWDGPPDMEPRLTPPIALRLAKRISAVSLHLLLDDPEQQQLQTTDQVSADERISLQRAAALRWYQHGILQACAQGLQYWASQ